MLSIQNVFSEYQSINQFRSTRTPILNIYERIIYSLDYPVRAYRAYGDDPRRGAHGTIYALFSRRNEREWGYFDVKFGCSLTCDANFAPFVTNRNQSWADLELVREEFARRIIWHNGERTIEMIHGMLDGMLPRRERDFREFLQDVNCAMI